jgi:hypothetical protein
MITKTGRRTHPAFKEIFREIFQRHPEAEDFDPCPCGLTLAIVEPQNVRAWHFAVPDCDLRERVRSIIHARQLGFACSDSPHGVLIIAEIA